MQLVLASQSPRRRDLLALFGHPFTVQSANIDETRRPEEAPEAYAERLSREKAATVAQQVEPGTLVLAADTVVADGATVLDKPDTPREAAATLRHLRGREHRVITAVTLHRDGETLTRAAVSPVRMRPYTDDEIAAYIATGDPFDKAGAYAIQHTGFHPVEGFDHCFANVMGLPLCHLVGMFQAFGLEPATDIPTVCQAHLSYDCPVYKAILSGQGVG